MEINMASRQVYLLCPWTKLTAWLDATIRPNRQKLNLKSVKRSLH